QRGEVRMIQKQDVNGALSDFNRVIILNPQYMSTYRQRILERQLNNDLEGAISYRKKDDSFTDGNRPINTDIESSPDVAHSDEIIPVNAKLYIAESSGFKKYLQKAIQKKKVPVDLVEDRTKADFELRGGYSGGAGHWTVCGGDMMFFPCKDYDD